MLLRIGIRQKEISVSNSQLLKFEILALPEKFLRVAKCDLVDRCG